MLDTHLINDLNVRELSAGGFTFVYLRDSDDGDTYQLGEDEILALHQYLGEVIARNRLAGAPVVEGSDARVEELREALSPFAGYASAHGACTTSRLHAPDGATILRPEDWVRAKAALNSAG